MTNPSGEAPPRQSTEINTRKVVVIVVHGIGEHGPRDILDPVERLIRNIPGAANATTNREQIPDFPSLSGDTEVNDALKVHIADTECLIVPAMWSGWRPRAGRAIEVFDTPVATPADIASLFGRAVPALLFLSLDTFRCISKARYLYVKAALALSGLVVLLASFAFPVLTIYFLGKLPMYLLTKDEFHFSIFGYLIPVFAIPTFFYWVYKKNLPLLDLIGDIARYVGHEKSRAELMARMSKIFSFAASRWPSSDLIVVGHSLGSVVTTQSVAQQSDFARLHLRLGLVTCGSPLRRLGRFFAKVVLPPNELAERYGDTSTVRYWVNLWNKSDYIGKRLFPEKTSQIFDFSLGDGFHAGYWRDVRLWAAVVHLMLVGTTGLSQAAPTWRDIPLSESEEADLRMEMSKVRHGWMDLFKATGALILFTGWVAGDFFRAVPLTLFVKAAVLWLCAIVFGCAMCIAGFNQWRSVDHLSARRQLDRLKVFNERWFMCFLLLVGFVASLIAYAWYEHILGCLDLKIGLSCNPV